MLYPDQEPELLHSVQRIASSPLKEKEKPQKREKDDI